jgi:hypothetical protein
MPAYVARHRAAHENFVMRINELWGIHLAGSEPPPTSCWPS